MLRDSVLIGRSEDDSLCRPGFGVSGGRTCSLSEFVTMSQQQLCIVLQYVQKRLRSICKE